METLTAQFPDHEPEREPAPQQDFNTAAMDEQRAAEEARLAKLEAERVPAGSTLEHTPGGTLEQASHESAWISREEEIAALRESLYSNGNEHER